MFSAYLKTVQRILQKCSMYITNCSAHIKNCSHFSDFVHFKKNVCVLKVCSNFEICLHFQTVFTFFKKMCSHFVLGMLKLMEKTDLPLQLILQC